MGREVGGYLRSDVADNPGKFVKYPFFNANSSVVSTGENNAAWAKATRLAGDGAPTATFALYGAGAVSDHNFVVVLRVPEKMGLPS